MRGSARIQNDMKWKYADFLVDLSVEYHVYLVCQQVIPEFTDSFKCKWTHG